MQLWCGLDAKAGFLHSYTQDSRWIAYHHFPKFVQRRTRHSAPDYDDLQPHSVQKFISDNIGRFDCLIGHLPIHVLGDHRNSFRIFTILRDPVERVLSLFRFLKSMPANAIAHLRLDPNFGLEELLQSRGPENYAQTHNLMCRMLCGDPALMDDSASVFWTPETAPESIQRSLINLDNMDFGLVEHMSSTLALLEDAYGLDFRLQEHFINTTVKSRGEGNLDIVHKIVQQNAADIVLYREASRIFHARVKGLATLTQRLNAPSHEYLAYRSRGD